MKPIIISLAFLVSTHLTNLTAQDALPSDSADLVTKLASFEEDELAKTRKLIAEKRAAVVKVLTSHMDRETRSGNLEAALALKEKIASLTALDSSSEKVPPSPSEDATDMTKAFFVGPVWRPTNGNDYSFQFRPDGSIEKVFKGKPFEFKWTIIDDLIKIEGGQREQFVADKRRKELWQATESGEKFQQYEPED